MSRRKNPDMFEKHEQDRSYRELNAPKMSNDFPNVDKLLVNLSFHHHDGKPCCEPKQLFFFPEHKAFFELKCPLWECVKGGFNFSKVVRDTINNRQLSGKTSIQCPGWQDRDRFHKHKCLLQADVEIEVTYKDET